MYEVFSYFFYTSALGAIISFLIKKDKKQKKINYKLIERIFIFLIIISFVSLAGLGFTDPASPSELHSSQTAPAEATEDSAESTEEPESSSAITDGDPAYPAPGGEMIESTRNMSPGTRNIVVHFIDVGQGDAILITQGESAMLIDAGDNGKGSLVVNYLQEQGISHLDYVIGTHPHADHIGGLADVIRQFEIGKIILPDIIHTTRTFEDLLLAIRDKGLKITRAAAGDTFKLANADLEIIGPVFIEEDDLNSASVICRLAYGSTAFLFTGDAENESELAVLREGYQLSADVIKISHHGSHSSSNPEFLSAVGPEHAVIMCGENNSYNHPAQQTLDRLSAMNINVYRTDLAGNIIAESDGSSISFNVEPQIGESGGEN